MPTTAAAPPVASAGRSAPGRQGQFRASGAVWLRARRMARRLPCGAPSPATGASGGSASGPEQDRRRARVASPGAAIRRRAAAMRWRRRRTETAAGSVSAFRDYADSPCLAASGPVAAPWRQRPDSAGTGAVWELPRRARAGGLRVAHGIGQVPLAAPWRCDPHVRVDLLSPTGSAAARGPCRRPGRPG